MAEGSYLVRCPTLRESVLTLVIVLVVPAVPLFVLLLVVGEIGTLPVVVGMLVYCVAVFGITLVTESRKDRGLRGGGSSSVLMRLGSTSGTLGSWCRGGA